MDNRDSFPARRETRALRRAGEASRDLVLKVMDRANALVKEIQQREKQAPTTTNLTVRVSTRTSTNAASTCEKQCPTAAAMTVTPSCKVERGDHRCEKRIHATTNLTLQVSARSNTITGITNSSQNCSTASATTLPSTKVELDKCKQEKQVLSTACLNPTTSAGSIANSANTSKSQRSVELAGRTLTTTKIELRTQQRQMPALVTAPLPSKSSTGTRTSTNNSSTGKSRCPAPPTVTSIHPSKIVLEKLPKTLALTATDLTSKTSTRASTVSTDTRKSRCPTAAAANTIPSQSSPIPNPGPPCLSSSNDNIRCSSKISGNDNRSVGKGNSKKSCDGKSSIDKCNTMKPCDNKSNIDKCSAKTNCDDKSKDKCHTKKNCDEKSNIDKCNTEKGCDDKSNTGKCIVRTSCEVNSSTDKCNRDKSCSKKSNNNNCSNQSSKDKAIANKTSNGKICGNQSSSNSKAISGKGNDKAIDDKSSHNQSSHKTPNGEDSLPLTFSSLSLLSSYFSSISLTKPHCCTRLRTPHPHLEYRPPTESTALLAPSVLVAPSASVRPVKSVKSGVPAAPVAPTSFAKPEKSVKSEKPFVPVAPVKPATKSCCVCIMSTGESSSALIVKPKPKRRTTFAPSSSITSTSIAHPFSVSSSQCICGSECDALYDELSRNLADAEYEYKECICFPQSRTGPLKKPTDPPDNTRLQRFWYRAKDMEEYLRMMEDYIDEVEACLKEYVTTRMRQREAVEEEQRRLRHELEVIKARAMLLGQGGDK